MTPDDIIAFGKARHGRYWITPLAEETGYSYTQLWRVVTRGKPITRRLVLEIERLKAKEGK